MIQKFVVKRNITFAHNRLTLLSMELTFLLTKRFFIISHVMTVIVILCKLTNQHLLKSYSSFYIVNNWIHRKARINLILIDIFIEISLSCNISAIEWYPLFLFFIIGYMLCNIIWLHFFIWLSTTRCVSVKDSKKILSVTSGSILWVNEKW